MCSGYSSEQKETGPLPPAAYSAVLPLNMWLTAGVGTDITWEPLLKMQNPHNQKNFFKIFNAESQVPDHAY